MKVKILIVILAGLLLNGCASLKLHVPEKSFQKNWGLQTFSGSHYFTKDGKRLALRHHDGIFRLHDLQTGKVIQVLGKSSSRNTITKNTEYLGTFDEDRKIFAMYEMKTGKLLKQATIEDKYPEFDAGTKLLVMSTFKGSQSIIRIWKPETGELLKKHVFGKSFWVVAISNDDKYLIQGKDKDGKYHLIIRDILTGEEVRTLTVTKKASSGTIFHSPDGKYLVAYNHNGIFTFDYESGDLVRYSRKIFKGFPAPHVSLYGRTRLLLLLSAERKNKTYPCYSKAVIYDFVSGKQSEVLSTRYNNRFDKAHGRDKVTCHNPVYAISNDSKYLAFGVTRNMEVPGVRCGFVEIYDVNKGKRINYFRAHQGVLLHLKFLPDNKTVVSSANDVKVKYWNVKKNYPLK